MIILKFIILAALIVFISDKLSKNAEIIEQNSKLNAVIVGIIIAFATSLPELATSITSAYLGEAEMAISNVLGSNIFNIVILAIMNFIFIKEMIYQKVSRHTNKINYFVIMIYLVIVASLVYSDVAFLTLGRFSIGTILIAILYFVALKILNKDETPVDKQSSNTHDPKLLRKALISFIVFASFILVFAILLATTANEIMIEFGLDASYVGAIFVGVSTSLPELTSAFSLCKSKNYDMAASSVLGSNLFNFVILFIVDIITKNPLLSTNDSGVIHLALLGILFTVLTQIAISFKTSNKYINLIVPTILIVTYLSFVVLGA